jgi:hypothetical protein
MACVVMQTRQRRMPLRSLKRQCCKTASARSVHEYCILHIQHCMLRNTCRCGSGLNRMQARTEKEFDIHAHRTFSVTSIHGADPCLEAQSRQMMTHTEILDPRTSNSDSLAPRNPRP